LNQPLRQRHRDRHVGRRKAPSIVPDYSASTTIPWSPPPAGWSRR